MNQFRAINSFFVVPAAIFVVLFVASSLRIIQFYYPHALENDPLHSPVKVQSVSGSTILLEDGRIFQIETFGEPLDKIIEASGFLVDIESEDGSSVSQIYAKHRGWICGTPWLGWIDIPLIPVDVPINHRRNIGFATAVANDAKQRE